MASNDTTFVQSINIQTHILSRYSSLTLGFILLINGTIGNCLNIFIFLVVGQYKQNASSLYMLTGSILNLLILLIGLTTRILSQGFNKDLTLINPVWCKMRISLLDIFSLSSYTCICLQSIDVYLATSRSVVMRQRSSIKIARCLLIGFIFLWIAQEIPSFLFHNLIYTNGVPACVTTDPIYVLYYTYITVLLLIICIPTSVISFFTFRIYKHLRSLTSRNQQSVSTSARQMARMALCQMMMVLLFQYPYSIVTTYFTATRTVSPVQSFFSIYVYGVYSNSFYCYYIASKRFRHQVLDTLKQFKIKRQTNQISPTSLELRQVPAQQQINPQ